ncbi:MAG: hypothetical protein KJT03_06095, partial [Verrucomicrobiae bacterium]|nr:hypothetical protein [Verrucomicrobiae bacterium]
SETFTLTIYTVVSDFASVEVPNPGQSPDRNRVNVSFGDRWVQINENNLEVSGTAQGSEYSMRVNGDKTSSGAGSRVKEMVFTNLNETSRIKRTAGVAVETSSLGNSVGETYSVYGSITVNTYFCIEDGGVKYLAPQGLSSLQTSDSLSAEEQPRIAGFQRSGDTLKFIWTGAIGKTFRFESTIDFESWEPIEGSQVTLASPIGFTELPYLGGSAIIRLAEVTET